jgi:hypothetical protein
MCQHFKDVTRVLTANLILIAGNAVRFHKCEKDIMQLKQPDALNMGFSGWQESRLCAEIKKKKNIEFS